MLDFIFGFLAESCVYSRLETSGNPQFVQQITKFSFEQLLFNLISGLIVYRAL